MSDIIEKRYCLGCRETLVYYPEANVYHCSECHEDWIEAKALTERDLERILKTEIKISKEDKSNEC